VSGVADKVFIIQTSNIKNQNDSSKWKSFDFCRVFLPFNFWFYRAEGYNVVVKNRGLGQYVSGFLPFTLSSQFYCETK